MSEERRGRMQNVGAVLPRIAGAALGKQGLGEAQLIQHWATIVGERYAQGTSPEKLSFPHGARRDGTLKLRVAPGLALEIQHSEPVLLERINGFFGYRAVTRLALRQTWLPRRDPTPRLRQLRQSETATLADTVAPVADDALRAALERLGAAIIATERK
ncbi:MAG TPA: DciA family protein [Stellaceae bacterium]|jgi:hypothetical protein|nr:DciA family protein [Stellaceae bacterium]